MPPSGGFILSVFPTIRMAQKKKPLDFSRGFCITGGSGEIRTRDQRIKRAVLTPTNTI